MVELVKRLRLRIRARMKGNDTVIICHGIYTIEKLTIGAFGPTSITLSSIGDSAFFSAFVFFLVGLACFFAFFATNADIWGVYFV